MASYETEQARLQRLMDEMDIFSDDAPDDSDDEFIGETLDEFETREEDSESEQDLSDGNETGNEDPTEESHVYLGKAAKGKENIKWRILPSNKNVRTRSHNIVSHLPGNLGLSKGKRNPLECWKCLFSDDIVAKIVEYTNMFIASKAHQYSRERDVKPTNTSEIFALLGLLYLAGVNKSGRLNTKQLWSTNGTGIELFRLTMSMNRFKFLLKYIRFDDKDTRAERLKTDKLSPIRELFEIFNENCKKSYCPSEYLTIDEKLEAFRGRCSFKQYIPSKPSKYGIKIFAMVDAKMFYTKAMEVYVGQQPEGPYCVSNSSEAIVKRLSSPIHGTGRNITIDNWFTSFNLVFSMLKDHKLTIVGTVKKNRMGIPPIFTNGKIRQPFSSMFGFREEATLVSYVPKKNKTVLLVSSMHHDDAIDSKTGEKTKPEIVTFYNQTKSGVDVVDRLCTSYNCARNTKRWPMVIFYSLLNVAGINSQVLYEGNVDEAHYLRRRLFLEKLSFQLVEEHLRIRAANVNVPRQIRDRIKELLQIEETVELIADRNNKRSSCGDCKKRRLTRYSCVKCKKFLCIEHSLMVCNNCSESFK